MTGRRIALCLALVLGGGLPAASASAATITFDDRAPGETVNVQYSSQGVTFNGPTARDYAASPGPGFAHSGSKGVEPCFAAEFCASPVRVTFTTPQSTVGVWVGFSSQLSSALGVRLTAYDASNAVVGTDNKTLPARGTPTPIATHLTASSNPARIVRMDVTVTTGGGYSSGLAVDDVEFSAAGGPPPCAAGATVPTVSVTQPPEGLVVHNNAFLLEGAVDAGGAPITSAKITSQGGSSRTAAAFPTPIDSDGGQFGPISVNGLLQVGDQKVFVTATNCRGTGSSAPVSVRWAPVPPGTRFRQLSEIEVTQSVQNPNNGVPLVGAANSGFGVKRTFARVYLTVEGGTSPITGVSGRLNAIRPDGSRPPGPQTIPSLNAITVNPSTTLDGARSSLQTSLNFELPPEWLGLGKLHLQLDRLEIGGLPTTRTCTACDNIDGNGPGPVGPAQVEFRTSPPLRLTLLSAPFYLNGFPANGRRQGDIGGPLRPVATRQVDIDLLASWMRRAYPTSDVQILRASLPARGRPPTSCDQVNADLVRWAGPVWRRPNRYYAMVNDNGGSTFVAGCVLKINGQDAFGGGFGSGPAGPPRPNFAVWDTDASYADAYGGHEIGHQFNRRHPGFGPVLPADAQGNTQCQAGAFQGPDDASFPYAAGLIGGAYVTPSGVRLYDNQAFDAGDASLNLPMTLGDWQTRGTVPGWHDVMSYCDDQWPSAYTYTGLMKYMCNGDAIPFCLNVPQVKGAVRARRAAKPPPGRRLLVTGTLTRKGRISLDPLSALPGLALTGRPKKSAYSIVLRGAGRKVLARYPFLPSEFTDEATTGRTGALIHEVVPFASATRRIEVLRGKRTLAGVTVSEHPPTVKVTAPEQGAELEGLATVRWRSTDADGGRQTYTLLYADDGQRFVPVAAGLRVPRYTVDVSGLPGGPDARFKVIATDGVLTGTATSQAVSVPVQPTQIQISTPAPEATVVAGEPTQLIAAVSDPQDGALSGDRIVWRSSLQGELGKGTAISAQLQAGDHDIIASATNSLGATTEVAVHVIAVGPPPSFDATPAG